MSQDDTIHYLEKHYTATFDSILEEDAVEAVEISRTYDVDEYEADMMLDALHRLGYLDHVDSDGGELYSAEDFDLENHQQVIDELDLL